MTEQIKERYELAIDRIARIKTEETVSEKYRGFSVKLLSLF